MKWRLDGGQIEVLDEALADVLRRKTPAEKVQMIAAARRTARQVIRAGVHHPHPDWDDDRVEGEVLRRLTRGTGKPSGQAGKPDVQFAKPKE